METETGLPGAVFRLRGTDGNLQVETSREDGWMCFRVQPGMRYVMAEISAPPGYESQSQPIVVWIDFNGRPWVNNFLMEPFTIPNQRMAQES